MKFSRKDKAARRSRGIHQGLSMETFLEELKTSKPDYKTAALCKQAARAVSAALSGRCGDPVLQDLLVMEVVPAPFAGRLQVTVVAGTVAGELPVEEVYGRLEQVMGMVRAEVASVICRKRTPELVFLVLRRGVMS